MKELSLREQQLILLDILKYFDGVCRKHNIKYTLCGGTLIGAIRHKGFIPWDDDIDIYITREEYEKFRKVWDKEKNDYYIFTDMENPDSISGGYIPKIYDDRTILSNTHNGMTYGLFIDIFVLDNIPDDTSKIAPILYQYRKNLFRFKRMKGIANNPNYHFIKRKLYSLLSKIFFGTIMGIMNNIRNKYHNKTNTLIPIYDTPIAIDKCIIQSHYFSDFVLADFEGEKFPVIAKYDEQLRNYYGDYMELPPEEERVPLHIAKAYLKD